MTGFLRVPRAPLSIRILTWLGVIRFTDVKYQHVVAAMLAVTGSILLAIATTLHSNVLIVRLDLVGFFVELIVLAITLAALRRSKAAPNDMFNFGLGKLENLCALLFTLVQVVYLVIFVWLAIERLIHPTEVEGAAFGAALYAYGAATSGFMIRGMRAVRKETPSPVIDALYRGYVIKLWTSVGTAAVLSAVAVAHDATLSQYLEPLNVIAICALRLYNISRIAIHSGRDLIDAAADETVQIIVLRALVGEFERYDSFLGYQTRRSPGTIFITIHLGFAPDRNLGEVFDTMDAIGREVAAHVADARVSVVPQRVPAGGLSDAA